MAARRRRPNAFEVSFPEEANEAPFEATSLGKRKANELFSVGDHQQVKRFQLPPAYRPDTSLCALQAARYKPAIGDKPIQETSDLVIPGEDTLDDVDIRSNDDADVGKPIRRLGMFTIFDPKHSNELVSLGMLEYDDGVDRQFEAIGYVLPVFENDEDEGQEDAMKPLLVRLSALLRCTVDYADRTASFYIETLYAWYILELPSRQYEPFYEHFYSPRRIAQLVISEAKERPNQTLNGFLEWFEKQNDFIGRTYTQKDIWKSVVEIQQALDDVSDVVDNPHRVPLIKSIVKNTASNTPARPRRNILGPRRPLSIAVQVHAGDRDFAVLKAENQNATHVTPFIASLAKGLVAENIVVVGPPPPTVDTALIARQKVQVTKQLKELLTRATKPKVRVDYDKEDRVDVQSDTYQAVTVEGQKFKIGDNVIIKGTRELPGWNSNGSAAPVKDDHQICDFFWFGKIMFFKMSNQIAHVQWYYHGMKTLMGELGHPQELLLSHECGNVHLRDLIVPIKVHSRPPDISTVPRSEYFCKFMYQKSIGAILSIDTKAQKVCDLLPPPSNCPACSITEALSFQRDARKTKDAKGKVSGVAYCGTNYHLEDFVLYNSSEGPANVGQIVHIDFTAESPVLTLYKVGRTTDLVKLAPASFYRDERHLYLTQEKIKVPVEELIRVVYAASYRCFENDDELEDWLDLSPHHFYIKYRFPKFKVTDWGDRRKLNWTQLFACSICCREMLQKRKSVKQFLRQMAREPLPTLDLFGGVGAFSGSIGGGSRCLKLAYTIEISPSASKTFQKNWDAKVANQCANVMLRYVIKSDSGHDIQVPIQLFDEKTPVPPPPKRGAIKVITAGFPCQSHSTLNMFHKADDIKSNLMLTTLSYIDWYRPIFIYLENVPGFLSHALNATQATKHRVEGGIKMGGLKLVVRALIEMGYQVRFALMQAGSYGTPQRRIRFFLIAALDGHPLPELPQPTHDFLDKKQLKIDCFDGEITPISVRDGKAAHPFVTIEAAIGDLLKFDFAHPKPEKLPIELRKTLEKRKTKLKIATVKCVADEKYWGFTGKLRYPTDPMTSYQKRARVRETKNIQHFVQPMKLAVAERVMHIPLKADADYRDLPRNQHEWQFVDPMSSHGQKNYKPGAYTRLNANTFFSTIVTNFGPTAKQSKVLHHSCLRTNTVRELARGQGFPDWFVFETLSGNVKHIQRQIGNAVPWQIGHALGRELREALFQEWTEKLEQAIRIDESDDDGDVQMVGPQVSDQPVHNGDDDDDDDDMYV